MPFKKQGPDDYTGPSGKHFDQKQVRMYYAHGGHFPGQPGFAGGGVVSNKGAMSKDCSYAEGGPVLGRTVDFMKAPDRFRQQDAEGHFRPAPAPQKTSDDWGKGSKPVKGEIGAPPCTGKSLKAVKPRS